jgi:hypothetical protein
MPEVAPTDHNQNGLLAADLPHLSWDLCDTLFKRLGSEFRKSPPEYYAFLDTQLPCAFGQARNASPERRVSPDPEICTPALLTKIRSVQAALDTSTIDLVVVHFRSRREPADTPRCWQRVLSGNLVSRLQLDGQELFRSWKLKRHAFEKVRENGTLLFTFHGEQPPGHHASKAECAMGPRELQLMIALIAELQKRPGPIEIDLEHTKTIVDALNQDRQADFIQQLVQYCDTHLQEPFADTPESVAFVMESCIVTLKLLASGVLQLPRAVLLAPVFVGSERVGGVSFFSAHPSALRSPDVARNLKLHARNVLTYLAIREGQEIELSKRLLDELSPVTHLFVHTFNKAFTTPMLNISDELASFSSSLADHDIVDPDTMADRLQIIASYLRSFARRWGGTSPPSKHWLDPPPLLKPRNARGS